MNSSLRRRAAALFAGLMLFLISGSGQLPGAESTAPSLEQRTFVLLKLVDRVLGLRVDQEDESLGLDLSQHGERAYNE